MVAKMVALDGTFAYFFAFFPICLMFFMGQLFRVKGPRHLHRIKDFKGSCDLWISMGRSSRAEGFVTTDVMVPFLDATLVLESSAPLSTLWLFNLALEHGTFTDDS